MLRSMLQALVIGENTTCYLIFLRQPPIGTGLKYKLCYICSIHILARDEAFGAYYLRLSAAIGSNPSIAMDGWLFPRFLRQVKP